MNSFWIGFEKRAEEAKLKEVPVFPSFSLIPAGIGAGAAGAAMHYKGSPYLSDKYEDMLMRKAKEIEGALDSLPADSPSYPKLIEDYKRILNEIKTKPVAKLIRHGATLGGIGLGAYIGNQLYQKYKGV